MPMSLPRRPWSFSTFLFKAARQHTSESTINRKPLQTPDGTRSMLVCSSVLYFVVRNQTKLLARCATQHTKLCIEKDRSAVDQKSRRQSQYDARRGLLELLLPALSQRIPPELAKEVKVGARHIRVRIW